MRNISLTVLITLFVTMHLAGCGGGGGGGASQAAQKTATITFGVISSASLHSVPINGIRITAILPAGVTVPIKQGTSDEIDAAALTWIKNGALPGSYSASNRQVTIGLADNSNIGLGDFVRLTCMVNSGVALSEKEFKDLNIPFPAFDVSGYDPDPNATVNPVDLTGTTKPTLSVTFGF